MNENNCGALNIGMTAPDFSAHTTLGDIKLSDYKGRWVILFSHPGDFTPICTSEYIAFSNMNDTFIAKNCYLLGISINSMPAHLAWIYNIYKTTGVTVPFPVIEDRSGEIARAYGMISRNSSTLETVRNVYFIDPDQKIRAVLIYPLDNGRSTYEILRLLEAMQLSDKEGVITPANWEKNKAAMVQAPITYHQLIERISKDSDKSGLYCKEWYRCYTSNKNPVK